MSASRPSPTKCSKLSAVAGRLLVIRTRDAVGSFDAFTLCLVVVGSWVLTVIVMTHASFGAAAVPIVMSLGFTFACARIWLNRTEIHLERDAISITHRPLPWLGTRTVARSELVTVGMRRNEFRGRVHYSVVGRDEQDESFTILAPLSRASADWVASEIARWLSLRSRTQNKSISPSETGGTSHS